MELSNISPKTHLLTEDDRTVTFHRARYFDKVSPTPEECAGRIKGICMSYASCGEQDFGISGLKKAFDIRDSHGVINQAPIEMIEGDGVKAIKGGKGITLTEDMIWVAERSGIASYWDDYNFLICAREEYYSVLNAIRDMIKPGKARFGLQKVNPAFPGCNFLILALEE